MSLSDVGDWKGPNPAPLTEPEKAAKSAGDSGHEAMQNMSSKRGLSPR